MNASTPPSSSSAHSRGKAVRRVIGDWAVDPSSFRLSRGGQTLRVEPKVMAVLVHLAERPGQVVGREALLEAVWPGVVVGDDALTQVVIKLRKALGDVRQRPCYIETIPKGGYRLIAPVRAVAEQTPPRRRILPALGVAGVVLAAAIGLGIVLHSGDNDESPARNTAADAETAGAVPTVAIRPFEPIGDDPQAALLARGLTADLITDLSKVQGLRLIGAASIGGQPGPEPAADGGAARYRVSGSVQRLPDRLRLQVHLVDAQTGATLWSERFERAPAEFFGFQHELGVRIAQTLPAKLSEAELRRLAQRHTGDLLAYEYFQRGQAALLVRQREANEAAKDWFRRAIDRDPKFARAYAGLALTHAADYRNQWTADRDRALARAFEMARTAHQIDPDVRETLWVLAFVHLERRQHDQALQHVSTALRLYPSFADGHALLGGLYTYVGRPADSIQPLRNAMRLNPPSGHLYLLLLGRAYLFSGDLEQARVNLQHALARNPVNLETHVYLAALHVTAGDRAAADWAAEEIRMLQPDFSVRRWLETYPMTDSAQRESLAQALATLGF